MLVRNVSKLKTCTKFGLHWPVDIRKIIPRTAYETQPTVKHSEKNFMSKRQTTWKQMDERQQSPKGQVGIFCPHLRGFGLDVNSLLTLMKRTVS